MKLNQYTILPYGIKQYISLFLYMLLNLIGIIKFKLISK